MGTASLPITLTGTTGTPGAWGGLFAEPGATVALDYTTVADAGNNCGLCAALYLDGSTTTLDHSTVTASSSDGVAVGGGGRLSVSNSRFVGNSGYGLHLTNPDDTSALTLANNTFHGNGYFDGVYLDGGTLTRPATWSPDWGPVEVGSSLTISGGVALTLTAGMSVSVGGGLIVQGALRALGTASAPITLTSNQASPSPGDWYGLLFDTGSSGTLAYATIANAGAYCYCGTPFSSDVTVYGGRSASTMFPSPGAPIMASTSAAARP